MKIISSEIVPVDMEFAFEWINKPFFHQRPTAQRTVNQYKTDMSLGRWNLGEGQIIIGVRPSASYLVAGMHRLTAVFELETVSIPMRVTFIEFATDDEMTQFYANGTNRGKPMGMLASLQVLGTAEAINIPRTHLNAFASTLNFIAGKMETRYVDTTATQFCRNPESMDWILRANQAAIYSFYRCLDSCGNQTRARYLRMPVVAIGLVTMKYQPEKSIAFWSKAASNDGLRKGEPEHTLHNHLMQKDIVGSGVTYHDYTAAVASCWNSYYDGDSRSFMRPNAAKTPKGIIVKGTPYNGIRDVDPLMILGVKGSAK